MKINMKTNFFLGVFCALSLTLKTYGETMPELTQIESFTVAGIEVVTSNDVEMNSPNPKIPGMWDNFYQNHFGKTLNSSSVYGVYTDYESDVNGEFAVVAAVKSSEAIAGYREVSIAAGNYLVFRESGEQPQSIVAAWQAVWAYFSNPDSQYQRAYTTDFEMYEQADEIAVYIAVK